MASLTNNGERIALDAAAGVSPASDRYVALFTTAPDETGGGTEVSGNGYTRMIGTFPAASTDGSNNTTSENTDEILFPEATASWGTITHMAVFDAATLGNMIWYGAVTEAKEVTSGDQYRFKVGDIVMSMD